MLKEAMDTHLNGVVGGICLGAALILAMNYFGEGLPASARMAWVAGILTVVGIVFIYLAQSSLCCFRADEIRRKHLHDFDEFVDYGDKK